MKTGFASTGIGRGTARRSALVARIVVPFLMLVGMLATLVPSPVAAVAQDGDTIPENVLAASVRIMSNFLVTPENGDDPFLCMLDDDIVLDWSVGSGTIITEDGYVLTNHHVTDTGRVPRIVRDFCEDQVRRGDAEVEFTQVAWMPDERGIPENAYFTELIEDSSPREDLAILQMTEGVDGSRLPRNLPVVEFGDSDALREPESIFIIGYPLNAGSSRRVSEGIFSGWGDNGYGVEWIYTDATISGGNSGGTAVNGDGLFVGVPTAMTASDCRPGDTNNDGEINEDDQGCIGVGGNYGILIPSNIAREFVEDALDVEILVGGETDRGSDDPDATEEPEPTDEPKDDGDGEMFGDITFFAYDEDEEPLDDFVNVTTLEACFENVGLEEGDEGTVTWFLDGDELHVTEFEWDDDWNPVACASIWNADEGVYLDPGTYSVELEANGETATSDEVEVEVD